MTLADEESQERWRKRTRSLENELKPPSTATRRSRCELASIPHAEGRGELRTPEEMLVLIYQQLRQLAAWHMGRERCGQTLQATALVHEAWLRLQGDPGQHWDSQRHFFAAAAEVMRRILIDRARQKHAVRHGGGLHRTEMRTEDLPIAQTLPDQELVEVDEALEALAAHDARKAELVKLRYFAGFTLEEVAAAQSLSVRTAKRDWAYARAWLYREILRRRSCLAVDD